MSKTLRFLKLEFNSHCKVIAMVVGASLPVLSPHLQAQSPSSPTRAEMPSYTVRTYDSNYLSEGHPQPSNYLSEGQPQPFSEQLPQVGNTENYTAFDSTFDDVGLKPSPAAPTPAAPTPAAPTPAAPTPAAAKAAAEAKKTYPDFKMTGFFQLDSAYFSQSGNNRATLGDLNDGLGFRRVRIAATGNVSERATYMMEFDFAQAQPRFVDLWGQVADTPLGKMRIGRFRQPNGMSELTSVRELPFLERPSLFALAPFRQTGIMFFDVTKDKRKTYAFSGYRTLSDNFGNVLGENGGYGLATRLTMVPIDWGDGKVVHLGFNYSYSDPARNFVQTAYFNEVFISQNPVIGPGGLSTIPIDFNTPFVQSGLLTVNSENLFNVEAAAGGGRTVIQSEFRVLRIATPGGTADVPAGYVHLRYMLTGEDIPYNYDNAVFGRVKPLCPLDASKGQWGAWEVAAQYSYINLNPLLDLPGTPGPGRRMNIGTLALNWYWWNNAKAQFEWLATGLNDRVKGDSSAQTFATRVQFDF